MTRSIPRRAVASLVLLSGGLAAMPAMAQAQRPPLELGLLPHIAARTLLAYYQPMREQLARALGRPVQLSTAPHWSEFHRRALLYEYDLMVTAIHIARLAQLDRDYRPLVQFMPDTECLLVCAAARPLASVSALRGHTLVLANPQSLVAVRGQQWLAEHGLRPGVDYKLMRVPTDDSAGSVLVRGDAIGALVSSGELRASAESVRKQLQVVNRFAEVPGFVVMASPRLADGEAEMARAALLALDARSAEGRAFLELSGLHSIRAVPDGLMASVDPLLGATRELLSAAP